MPSQQHLIMDLPALWSVPFLHGNGLIRMDSVLAYDHCGWPTARTARRCWHGRYIGTDNGTDKVKT